MKIAFLGSRGIPARYSGFETFYEQLATRLAQRGHHVTVYNRSHFIKDVRGRYQGVRLVTLPSVPTKHLDTTTHTLVSSFHALTQGARGFTEVVVVTDTPVPTSPCGACRQILWEFARGATVVMVARGGATKITTVADLVPLPFDESAL